MYVDSETLPIKLKPKPVLPPSIKDIDDSTSGVSSGGSSTSGSGGSTTATDGSNDNDKYPGVSNGNGSENNYNGEVDDTDEIYESTVIPTDGIPYQRLEFTFMWSYKQ